MTTVRPLQSPRSKLLAALAALPACGFFATTPVRADELVDSVGSPTLGTAGAYTLSGSGNTLTVAAGADRDTYNPATDDLLVGIAGTGTLNVSDGASVSVTGAGTVIIDPINGDHLAIGGTLLGLGSGSSGTLNVSGGATVSSNWIQLGTRPDATGVLNVSGAGSSATIGAYGLWIYSSASAVNVSAGATLNTSAGDLYTTAGSLDISGGSHLVAGYVALDTSNNAQTYIDAGLADPGAYSATATITGAGTTMSATEISLLAASAADTVSLAVTDHATLNGGPLGLDPHTSLTVTDGATVSLTDSLGLGGGSSLSLASGASLSTTSFANIGGDVTLTGSGTTLSTGALTLAENSSAASLTLSGGATATVTRLTAYALGNGESGNTGAATILLTGAGTRLTVNGTAGPTQSNHSLAITDGAELVTNRYLYLDGTTTVSGGAKLTSTYVGGTLINELSGTATITGSGSALGLAKNLAIESSESASLTIADHASFTSTAGITVGRYSSGSFNVTSGATASTMGAAIGSHSATTGPVTNAGHATVTGAGSVWTNTGALALGARRDGDLTVSAGGVLNNTGDVTLGSIGAVTATATVTGAGSQLNATGTLTVGHSGAPVGRLTIADHARVSAASVVVNSGFADTGYLDIGGFGQLAATSVTVNSGGTLVVHDQAVFSFDLGSASSDAPIDFLAGSQMPVDTDATVYFYLHQTTGFGAGEYALFSFDAASSQSGIETATFAVATDFGGYGYSISRTSLGITLTVTEAPGAAAYAVDGLTTPIPEPASAAVLAGLGALGLAASRRRRRA